MTLDENSGAGPSKIQRAREGSDMVRKSLRQGGNEPAFPEGMEDPVMTRRMEKKSPPEREDDEDPYEEKIGQLLSPEPLSSSVHCETESPPRRVELEDREEKYPNASDDPEPIPKDSSEEDKKNHYNEIMEYTDDMLSTYKHLGLKGEKLCFSPTNHKTVEEVDRLDVV